MKCFHLLVSFPTFLFWRTIFKRRTNGSYQELPGVKGLKLIFKRRTNGGYQELPGVKGLKLIFKRRTNGGYQELPGVKGLKCGGNKLTMLYVCTECDCTSLFKSLSAINAFSEYIKNSWVELNWLFNVTINDISVIYVTAHRCAGGLKKLDLRSGSQRHRHFVGFFNVLVQAPTRGLPHLVAFYNTLGIRRTHSRLNPRVPTGVKDSSAFIKTCTSGEMKLLFYVTINNISVIYVRAHKCASLTVKKKRKVGYGYFQGYS